MTFSKNLYRLALANGFQIDVSVNTQGEVQASLSFPFSCLFNVKAFAFANKLNDYIAGKEVNK